MKINGDEMTLSRMIRLFVAKSSQDSKEYWLPLYIHANDVAGVIVHLFYNRMSEHERRCLCSLSEEETVKLIKFLALTHDIAKLTIYFQLLIKGSVSELLELFELLEREGINLNIVKSINHAQAGEVILREFEVNEKICEIIGSHHGKPQDTEDVENCSIEDIYGRDKAFWREIWKEWIDYSLEYVGYNDISELHQKLSMTEQMLLTGLLITAD